MIIHDHDVATAFIHFDEKLKTSMVLLNKSFNFYGVPTYKGKNMQSHNDTQVNGVNYLITELRKVRVQKQGRLHAFVGHVKCGVFNNQQSF